MRTAARFFALSRRRQSLAATAALLQVGLRLIVTLGGLSAAVRCATWLSRFLRVDADPQALSWALSASAARVRGSCLTQALAARALSGSVSAGTRLIIGARKSSRVPEFHAWTEMCGATLPLTLDASSFEPVKVWN